MHWKHILISKNATVITILVAAVVVMTILTIIFARYATVYNDFFLPNNLHNDTDFLTHDLVHRWSSVDDAENDNDDEVDDDDEKEGCQGMNLTTNTGSCRQSPSRTHIL